jgi:porin
LAVLFASLMVLSGGAILGRQAQPVRDRDRFVGAWRLVSLEGPGADGIDVDRRERRQDAGRQEVAPATAISGTNADAEVRLIPVVSTIPRFSRTLVAAALLHLAAVVCHAQVTTVQSLAQGTAAPSDPPKVTAEPTRSIEDLNLVGAAVTMPPLSDSLFGVDAGFRRAMLGQGMLLRVNVIPRFSQNLLEGPAPEGQQVYIGHRPTFISGVNPIFTADLRQLHLRQAQLNVGVGWRWSSWQPASPNTFAMTSLHFFKRWGDRRVEMKAGYITNDTEFVGLQVGGSTSTGAQGVYAVLPNEVGLSYFPLAAPSVNLRLKSTGYTYFKTAAQRSLDAAGGQSTVDRNPSGFRFLVDGNGVLLINEGGYQRPSSASAPLAWFRAGYMRNSTHYLNRDTEFRESGNYCAYVLMDYQLRMPDLSMPSRGLFVGGTAMTVPSQFNPYDRYYEARLYQRGTFSSRPTDVLSVIAGYRNHSRFFTDPLVAQDKTVWRNSPSLTGTYTLHASRGNYLSLSLGYVRGPALSPRVPAALVFTANWSLYL